MTMLRNILNVLILLHFISCHEHKGSDKIIKSEITYKLSDMVDKLDSCDIAPLPKNTLNDTKKMFYFFKQEILQKYSSFHKKDSVPFAFIGDFLPYTDNQNDKSPQPYLTPNTVGLFCNGFFINFPFNNNLDDSGKNYSFIKTIFSDKIIDKHQRDGTSLQELYENFTQYRKSEVRNNNNCNDTLQRQYLYYLDTMRAEAVWDDYKSESYYNLSTPNAYFVIKKIGFSDLYTAIVFEASLGVAKYGKILICTYNHDGEFIDGIEYGIKLYITEDELPPLTSYTYFDKDGLYHVIKSSFIEDLTKKNKITEKVKHLKYRLSKHGKFELLDTSVNIVERPVFQ